MLSTYGALDVESKPSPLGLLVGDVRSENELWAAMVLLSDGLADLEGTPDHHSAKDVRPPEAPPPHLDVLCCV